MKHCWRGEQAFDCVGSVGFWPTISTVVNKINLERDVIHWKFF